MRCVCARRFVGSVLLGVAVLAVLALGASVPHLHVDEEPAFFNQEHDLTLLAGLAGFGLTPEAGPAVAPDPVSSALPVVVPERPPVRLAYAGESRAPPAA